MFKCPQKLNSCDLSDFLRFSVRKIKFGFKSAKNTKKCWKFFRKNWFCTLRSMVNKMRILVDLKFEVEILVFMSVNSWKCP